jgi:methyl-accepting chemotaxis protein
MNTLSLSVNLVNDNMNSITEDVNNTSKLSAEVREIMDLLNKKTILSKSVSTKVFHDINNLNNEMKKIQDIVTVIMEITEQTNLLSFNATIEAARAGEAGRGFAVVANEIKKLSDQSKQASNTIHTILSSIQAINDETISATSNADTIFKEQMASVRWANDKINYILGFMDQITNKIFTMKTSVNDIFLIKQKTADSVVSISAVSEQNAAIVQEVAASTDEQTESSKQLMLLASDLNDMTESLTKALSNFIV